MWFRFSRAEMSSLRPSPVLEKPPWLTSPGQDVIAQAEMSSLLLSVLIVLVRLDWGLEIKEREVKVEAENERVRWGEIKKCKIINVRDIVIVHTCMVTIAIVHKCTILHPLMWVIFWVKICKMRNIFLFCKSLHMLIWLLLVWEKVSCV